MKTKADRPGQGWYQRPGINGVVSLQERVAGLHYLAERCQGRTVLDLGCAEGLISQWLVDHGALFAAGFDYNLSRVEQGNSLTSEFVELHVADLSEFDEVSFPMSVKFDIVLLLAILQKMKEPERLLDFAISHCVEYLAVRTPHQIIDDPRSGNRKIDTKAYIMDRGFEWMFMRFQPVHVGIYRRCS